VIVGLRSVPSAGSTSPQRETFNVEERIALGRFLVAQIGPTPGESSALATKVGDWVHKNRSHRYASSVLSRLEHPGGVVDLGWTLEWAMSGFQRVLVGHKLAASLMATHAGDDPQVMMCAPWNAYTIEIPPELVQVPDATGCVTSFDVIAVWHSKGDATSYLNIYSRSSPEIFTGKLEFPLPPFDEDALEQAGSDAVRTAMTRAVECAARLVVSVELEMTEPDRVKAPPSARRKGGTTGESCGVHASRARSRSTAAPPSRATSRVRARPRHLSAPSFAATSNASRSESVARCGSGSRRNRTGADPRALRWPCARIAFPTRSSRTTDLAPSRSSSGPWS
jgi:hypothetical protein